MGDLVNKKFFIETFGCQMNEYDSEKISGLLYAQGYQEILNKNEADLIIFNTCLIRENAEKKLYGKLGAVKNLKLENPSKIIALCGCIPQNDEIREYIIKKFPYIDIVFGTNTYDKLPELLYDIENKRKKVVSILKSNDGLKEKIPKNRKFNHKAFVNIMYGCNNFCSYCVVPYTRGRELSRDFHDIVSEVTELGHKGYKEITLLGQNVNSYLYESDKTYNFADLLRELNKIDSISRIRFVSSHPKDVTDEFILAMKDCDKVCNHIHLPIQSGSTKVLKEMNRKYSKEYYSELIRKLRLANPGIAVSTDFIIGFPGESEEDFNETIELVKDVKFDSAFTFLYSIRPGTPAGKRNDQIDEKIKHERFDKLLKILYPIFEKINISYIGTTVELLVDNVSKNDESYMTGRTDTNKIVHFKGDKSLLGKLVSVKIEKAKTWYMEGTQIG